ncbi:MAG: alpha/beta fold hydrolase [Alphaproteobacteria bacterium]|nr:alpha/beta fold hydrolase [Alphaproteobacteria bacterium]
MDFFSFFKKQVKPFDEGFLDVGDGHEIHYMQFGTKKGIPVLLFHGGPGGQAKSAPAAYNLKKYRVVIFSQRGCGKSRFKKLLEENTTLNSVKDAFLLLRHLKINSRVVVGGGSFGSTLALLFALEYPQKVRCLLLNAIFLGRKKDIDFPYNEMFLFYPEAKAEFERLAGNKSIEAFFKEKIFSEKYKDIQLALQYYGSYENQLGKMQLDFKTKPAITDQKINSLKIFLTYIQNNLFIKEDFILKNIDKINDIPTLIIHNRFDFCCPVDQAWLLHKKMRRSKLVINEDYNHYGPGLNKRLKKEIEPFLKKIL